MRRFAISAPLSAALVIAFGDAGSAQQISAEKLVGGIENPPVVSDGSGRFRARLKDDSISFRLSYDSRPTEATSLRRTCTSPIPKTTAGSWRSCART
jgi:hypothetical protein